MIHWIDILSPRLRALHQHWIQLRGNFIMPGVRQYDLFTSCDDALRAEAFTLSVLLPLQGPPTFRQVGPGLRNVLPACYAGQTFDELRPPVVRATITQPFHRAIASRQPEVRRQRQPAGPMANADQEILLLPFSDARLRVCIIHAVYDLKGIDWRRATA